VLSTKKDRKFISKDFKYHLKYDEEQNRLERKN